VTLYYADPEAGANIPVKTRTVSGEQVPGHDVLQLPGTVEADAAAIAAAIATIAGAVAAGRVAVDLATTPLANLATLAAAVTSNRVAVDLATTPTANLATLAAAITNLATIVANQAPPSAVYGGKTTVTTAGIRAALASSQALVEGVWVRALDANTGLVYVGNSSVSSTAAGTRLAAKEAIFVRIDNLSKVNIDVATNGEGVTYLGW
jgi:hypothetical protein